jgi:hypothetical protein
VKNTDINRQSDGYKRCLASMLFLIAYQKSKVNMHGLEIDVLYSWMNFMKYIILAIA